jgi:hypothetical protein
MNMGDHKWYLALTAGTLEGAAHAIYKPMASYADVDG